MGPVVNEGALKTVLNYVEIGKKEGRLVIGGEPIDTPEKGYFVQSFQKVAAGSTVRFTFKPASRICPAIASAVAFCQSTSTEISSNS